MAWPFEKGNGFLKKCRDCGETIYLCHCSDGQWRPYESWVAGNAEEGEFHIHECTGKSDVAHMAPALNKLMQRLDQQNVLNDQIKILIEKQKTSPDEKGLKIIQEKIDFYKEETAAIELEMKALGLLKA